MTPHWLTRLIRRTRDHVVGRPDLQAIVRNSGWLVADRSLRILVGLVVSVWVARYLGPEQYGTLNYAMAFVALFSACATLGLETIVIRDLSRTTEGVEVTLGTTFALKLAGATVTLGLSFAAIGILRPEDGSVQYLVAIIAAGTLFQAFDVIDFWYQSRVRSKHVVFARNTAFLVISLIKILLIVSNAPLIAFAWAALGEVALGACGLVLACRGVIPRLGRWRFSGRRSVELLRESWPLFLSAVFVLIYVKIDKIMIGQILGEEKLGIYAAATQLAEVWYFIPMAITSSVFPFIVAAKSTGESQYYARLEQLYLVMVWLALAVAVPITLFSGPIVELVFGAKYAAGAAVLAIHCWAGLFIFAGLVSNHWYVLEKLNHYTLYRHVLGAGINILLNIILIPALGIAGAAVATIITQFATSYLFDLINRRTRVLFRIKSRHFLFFLPITIRYLTGRADGGNAK